MRIPFLILALVAGGILAVAARADVKGDAPLGTPGTLPGQLLNPTGVARGFDGNVYIANTGNDRIEVYTTDNTSLGALGSPGTGPGQFSRPSSVAALPAEAALLVLDAGNNRVQKITLSGTPVAGFTVPSGTGPLAGSFNAPQGITVDFNGKFYVADTGNNRVQVFDPDGTFLQTVGEGQLSRPRGVALGPDGTLYVTDSGHNQVVAYPPGAAQGTAIIDPGTLDGGVIDPGGIAVDGLGRIVVADSANARIERFSADGTYLDSYVGEGSARLQRPEGIFVTPPGDLFVADATASVVVRAHETLPPPVAGQTANVAKTGGQVLVKLPNSNTFEQLKGPRHIPVNTVLDTRKGAVQLLSAASTRPGDTQTGNFYDGRFTFKQSVQPKVVTNLLLTGGSFASCPGAAQVQAARKAKQKPKGKAKRSLWGNAVGPTKTTGRDAVVSHEATEWLTEDYCNGTLVKVKTGVVLVRSLRQKNAKPVRVTAGNQLFVPHRP
jgi:sugar lactone lactonase YvrE